MSLPQGVYHGVLLYLLSHTVHYALQRILLRDLDLRPALDRSYTVTFLMVRWACLDIQLYFLIKTDTFLLVAQGWARAGGPLPKRAMLLGTVHFTSARTPTIRVMSATYRVQFSD